MNAPLNPAGRFCFPWEFSFVWEFFPARFQTVTLPEFICQPAAGDIT
jgi:hypothetical protein